VRQIGETQQTFPRWRKLDGGTQLVRLTEVDNKSQWLRSAVAALTLDKLIFTEVAKGNF